MIEPSGRSPSRIAVAISASVQRPMPVSGSGVIFGATAHAPGRSRDDRAQVVQEHHTPPASSFPGSICPFGSRVLWHTPQKATVSTR